MLIAAQVLTGIIALLHLYIMWLEMFAWTTVGRKVFRQLPAHLFESTRKMAANQGLYNGFLAAGLIWALCITNAAWKANIALFFLGCVLTAGIYGAATVSRRILYVQAIPAFIAMLLWLI